MPGCKMEHIMVPIEQYPRVKASSTLLDVMNEMDSARIKIDGRESLPRKVLVFDELDILVGIVRRRDIVRGLVPDFMSATPEHYRKKLFNIQQDPALSELSVGKASKGIRNKALKPVLEVMTPIQAIINCEDDLMVGLALLVENDISLMPVMKGDRIVGVVRSAELFRELTKIANKK